MKVEFTINVREEDQHKLVSFLQIFAKMLLVGWDETIIEPKIDGEDIGLY